MSTVSVILPTCDDPVAIRKALHDPIAFDALLAARRAFVAEHPHARLRDWIVFGSFLVTSAGSIGPILLNPLPDGDDAHLIDKEAYFRRFAYGGYSSRYAAVPNAEMTCGGCGCGFDVRDYGQVRKDPAASKNVLFHVGCWEAERRLRMKVRVASLVETAGLPMTGAGLYLARNEYDPEGESSDGYPWMRVQLEVGTFLLGFRRHVWSLDYAGLGLDVDLFPGAATTHMTGVVHLNNTGDVVDALKTIRTALAARRTS